MRRRRVLLSAGAIAATAMLHAQQQTTFRAETNYVEVDAVVTDGGGHFVPGLTAADFEVREQKSPQSISTFTYIDMPIGPGAASSTPPMLFRADLSERERIVADRIYLLYVNFDSPLLARVRAREFVRDYLQPNDVAAVWNAEADGSRITFTNDKDTLVKAIGQSGVNVGGTPQGRDAAQGAKLRDAIDWLDGIQGRRKSLILFTEGWGVYNSSVGISVDGRPARERVVTEWLQGRRPGDVMTGVPWLNPTDITNRSDVHIYSYDVRGRVAPDLLLDRAYYPANAAQATAEYGMRRDAEIDSAGMLRTLAEQTGGLAFVESNDYKRVFSRKSLGSGLVS